MAFVALDGGSNALLLGFLDILISTTRATDKVERERLYDKMKPD
jgi:hypothetical protein